MGIQDQLAKIKVEEFAERGKRISFKLAWYIAEAQTKDELVWLLTKGNWARKDITSFLGISERFLEISLKRLNDEEEGTGKVGILEQIAEVRAKELKDAIMMQDKELFEKEWYLRNEEKLTSVKVFLQETDYSDERIAELVGVSVSMVKMNREWIDVKWGQD